MWRNLLIGGTLVVTAVVFASAGVARAWNPILNDALMWLRWDVEVIPVRLAAEWPAGFDEPGLGALLTRATRSWALPDCGQPLFEIHATVDGIGLDESDGVTTVVPIDDKAAWDPRFGATELARTLIVSRARDGVIVDADIVINVGGFDFATAPQCDPERYDLEGTITHELGHVLGLDHSDVESATMFPNADPGRCTIRDLDVDDAEGICALYPKPAVVEPGPEPMPEPPAEPAVVEAAPDVSVADAAVEVADAPPSDGCCGGGDATGWLALLALGSMRLARGRRANA